MAATRMPTITILFMAFLLPSRGTFPPVMDKSCSPMNIVDAPAFFII